MGAPEDTRHPGSCEWGRGRATAWYTAARGTGIADAYLAADHVHAYEHGSHARQAVPVLLWIGHCTPCVYRKLSVRSLGVLEASRFASRRCQHLEEVCDLARPTTLVRSDQHTHLWVRDYTAAVETHCVSFLFAHGPRLERRTGPWMELELEVLSLSLGPLWLEPSPSILQSEALGLV